MLGVASPFKFTTKEKLFTDYFTIKNAGFTDDNIVGTGYFSRNNAIKM
tara:strand:+ start:65 stop:208 length:144 start_codon:yes stop_codon:yes gene_type:complete